MNNKNLKNKFIIYKMIRDYFCLDERSLKLFKYRLFQEPLINKEFKTILGNSPDLRMRIDVKGDMLEKFDDGWDYFKNNFLGFVAKNKLTYSDFRENKYKGMKIGKQIIALYKENAFFVRRDLSIYIEQYLADDNSTKEYTYHRSSSKGIWIESDFIKYDKLLKEANNKYFEAIETKVKNHLERSGVLAFSKKNKLQLVFSLNFADWILCSSGESWSSCMSLESDFEDCYWTGLPGLIGEKNRCFVYLTDGKTKNYNGIIVDRIISRSWIFTVRNEKNKTGFFFVGAYPIEASLEKLASQYFNMNFLNKEKGKLKSRYYNELLYHKMQGRTILASVFNDYGTLKIAKKNKASLFPPGRFGYYNFPGGGGKIIYEIVNNKVIKSDSYFYYVSGFSALRYNGLETAFGASEDDYEEDYFDDEVEGY